MKKILIDQTEPGMVLEMPVHNASGMVLLGVGTELTPTLLRRMKEWGVAEIMIKEDLAESAETEGETAKRESKKVTKLKEEIARDLDHRFQGFERNPTMMTIKKAALEFLSSKK